VSSLSARVLFAAVALALPLEAQRSLRATRVASGLDNPVGACAPSADLGRLFIVEQASAGSGRIRVLDTAQNPPALQATPYLTVAPILAGGEQGLLGLAFHPGFAANGYFFVYYTNTAGDDQVVRYRAHAPYASSTTADPASATPVMTISHPGAPNHNGGALAFGPDGCLYIGTGDGGSGSNSQDPGLRLGKLMRIDVDSDGFPSDPANNYAIPPGNPFVGVPGALPEIWHLGLRNAWRVSFDRQSGDMWIGDVGAAAIEELDFVPAGLGGLNFGWDCVEGTSCTGSGTCVCPDPALAPPVHTYPHTSGNCCVIGGYRYRGAELCDYQGLYFFGDFCSARVWSVEWNGSSVQNLTDRSSELAAGGGPLIGMITSFGEDARGELYVCDLGGQVFRIGPGSMVDCNGNGTHDGCDLEGGTSHDWNGDGVPDECEPTPATASCFGDGSLPTACPCANTGAAGRGCQNSASTGGARLEGAGDPASDQVVLVSSGELASVLTIFLQGNLSSPGGILFGDGLRCASGALKRLYAHNAVGGVAHAPQLGEPSITQRSTQLGDPLFPLSGQVRYYQAYYRDPQLSFCPAPAGSSWNVSSMLTIQW
jgi:glucose/arabinose dehydrogenase